MPAFHLNLVILGVIGGILPDAIRIIKMRYKANLPAYLKRGAFWLGFVLSVLLGGLAAWLLSARDAKTALALGFAAPEVFSRLIASSGPADRGDRTRFSLREWWLI